MSNIEDAGGDVSLDKEHWSVVIANYGEGNKANRLWSLILLYKYWNKWLLMKNFF